MKRFFIILLFFANNVRGQQMFYSLNTSGYQPCPPFGVDTMPSGVYSFRKIINCYGGNGVAIRRASDNTSKSFGFVSGFIDTASIKTFIGSSNAFVLSWYDQSNNGNDMSQATNANQPQIAVAGALIYAGGKLCMQFNGTSDFLAKTGIYYNDSATSIFTVTQSSGAGIFAAITTEANYSSVNGTNMFVINKRATYATEAAHYYNSTYVAADIGTSSTNVLLNTGIFYYPTFMASDGTSTATNTMAGHNASSAYTEVSMGALIRPSPAYYAGNLIEAILYQKDMRTDRATIESNIKTYYGL